MAAADHRDTPTPVVGGTAPFVSLHVPAHNEPPDMVIQTLTSLRRIEYPEFEVICVDDNTEDEAMWRPVAEWCATHGIKFAHLQDWPGYKSGALNYALREMTSPRAELIGVVDSDYQGQQPPRVEPDSSAGPRAAQAPP